MVRKITVYFVCLLALFTAFSGAAQAATYQPYEGNISTSNLTYFQDLLPKLKLTDHYVFFRSGQYEYTLISGDIKYANGVFSSGDDCTVYSMSTNNSYNGYYAYNVTTIDSLSLNPRDILVYSDLGGFPELENRGVKYEIIQTILIIITLLAVVIRSIFYYRKRG